MFCRKCGKQLKEGSVFCTGCGTRAGVPESGGRSPDAGSATTPSPAQAGIARDESAQGTQAVEIQPEPAGPHDDDSVSGDAHTEQQSTASSETPEEKISIEEPAGGDGSKDGIFGRIGKSVKGLFGKGAAPADTGEKEAGSAEAVGSDEEQSAPGPHGDDFHFDSGVSLSDIENTEDIESISVGNPDEEYRIPEEPGGGESADETAGVPRETAYEYQKQVNLLNVYLRQARETWFQSAIALLNKISSESGNEIAVANSSLSGDGGMALEACQFVLSGMRIDEKNYLEKGMISQFMMGYFDSMNHGLNDVMRFNDMLKSYTGEKNFMSSVADQVSRYISGKQNALLESMILVHIIPELVAYTNIAVSEAFDDIPGAREQIDILKKYERKLYSEFQDTGSENAI